MRNAPHLVLYDDQCPMCTFQMRVLSWVDWFRRLELVPMSSPRVAVVAPTISRPDLLEAIHCVAANGRIYRGARCLRLVGLRLPLLVPLALLLWVPGVIWVAEWVYRWVSRHRYILSRVFGCKAACARLPERPPPQEKTLNPVRGKS